MSETEKPKRKRAKRRPLAKLYEAVDLQRRMALQILREATAEDMTASVKVACRVLSGDYLEGSHEVGS